MFPLKPVLILAVAPLALQATCDETPVPTTGTAVGEEALMAESCGFCHDASGVATVVDEDTIRIDDFTYDGNAPDAYVYLGVDGADLATSGIRLSAKLSRAYQGETVTFDLPEGVTLADFDSIAVYCYRYDEVFAWGVFGG